MKDELFDEVLAFILERKKVSISAVQRTSGIGYNHAARLLEQMSDDIPSEYYPDLDNLNSGRTAFSMSENKDSTYSNDLLIALDHGKRFTEFDDQLTGAHIAHYHLMDGVIDRQYPLELNSFPLGNSSSVQDIFDAEIIHHVVMRAFIHAKEDLISFDSEDLEVHFLGHHQFIQLTLTAHADTFLQDLRTLWQSQLLAQINQYRNHHAIEQYFAILIGDDNLELEVYEFIGELLKAPALTSSDGIMKTGVRFTDSNDHSSDQMTRCVISLRLRSRL